MSWKPFGATNRAGSCLWCGAKLRHRHHVERERVAAPPPRRSPCCRAAVREDKDGLHRCASCERGVRTTRSRVASRTPRYEQPGDYGDGHFCGLRCAYSFGVAMADLGKRLKPPEPPT